MSTTAHMIAIMHNNLQSQSTEKAGSPLYGLPALR